METLKICNTCGETKNLEEFSKNSQSKDGHRGNCKICHNQRRKISRKINVKEDEKEDEKEKEVEKEKRVRKKGSKYDKTLKELIYIAEEYKNVDDFPEEKFYKLCGELMANHRAELHPSSNIIKINDCKIIGPDKRDAIYNKNAILSRMGLFLANKGKGFNNTVEIMKDKDYNMNSILIIKLPEHITLTYNEIQEFIGIMVGVNNEEKYCSVEIEIDGIDLNLFMGQAVTHIYEYFRSYMLINISFSDFRPVTDGHKITISWPKEFAVPDSDIKKITDSVSNFLFGILVNLY
jgi:hypothetical protein